MCSRTSLTVYHKYLGSLITENGRCELDIKSRIGMAKGTLWKHKELLRGKINLKVKKRILDCYIFPVLKYSCENWTLNNDLTQRINAFEQWCYRRSLKIKWSDKVSNEQVLHPGMWSRSRRLGLEIVSRRTNVSSQSISCHQSRRFVRRVRGVERCSRRRPIQTNLH